MNADVLNLAQQWGRDARDEGLPEQACPYGVKHLRLRRRWKRGWRERDLELERNDVEEARHGAT